MIRSKEAETYLKVNFYLFLFIYLIRYLKSMFTIDKKIIYIDTKRPNKMKKFKLIKWVGAGRYMSNSNKYQYIPN